MPLSQQDKLGEVQSVIACTTKTSVSMPLSQQDKLGELIIL